MKLRLMIFAVFALCASSQIAAFAKTVDTRLPKAAALRETASIKGAATTAFGVTIWPSPTPALTRIIGANQPNEITLYDLKGAITQRLGMQQPRAVTAADVFYWLDGEGGILAASNGTDNSIAFFKIDPKTGTAESRIRSQIRTSIKGITGLCMNQVGADLILSATGADGQVKTWTLALDPWGSVTGIELASFKVKSATSSCAIDGRSGALYIAETDHGIWRVALTDHKGTSRKLVDSITPEGRLAAPISALALWSESPGNAGFLLATNGSNAALQIYYPGPNNRPATRIQIGQSKNKKTDQVTGGWGLASSGATTDPAFPLGFVVIQDSENTKPKAASNFKIVGFTEIQKLIPFE